MSCDAGELYRSLWAQTRLELPGSVDPVLELAFQQVLRAFFRDSRAWQEELRFRAFSGRKRYDLNNYLRHAKVQWVLDVLYDEREVKSCVRVGDCISTEPADPNKYAVETNSTLVLDPVPEFARGDTHNLCVHVAVVPPAGTISASGCGAIPGDLLQTWFDAILWGVLGRMMTQHAKPYTNLQLGNFHLRQYTAKVQEAKHVTNKGSTVADEPWRFPAFA